MSLFLTLETVIFFIGEHVDMDGEIIVAVSCCTALSFSTLEMESVSVCSPFSWMWVARLWALFNPLMKILMVAASFVKLHLP